MLYSARWLALSYFTYYFSFGVFLPFWSLWLNGEGVSAESIGWLLGLGLVARFLGNLVITASVAHPTYLIPAIRILALLSLLCAAAFSLSSHVLWLATVLILFNLLLGPITPLSDALAGIWQRQINMDYGKARLWGSLAFIIGTTLTGKGADLYGHQAILVVLLIGLAGLLLGLMLKPSAWPQGEINRAQTEATPWKTLLTERNVWRFLLCATLIQSAHAAYYAFSALHWQQAGYSSMAVGYLWSLGVVAEIVVFAMSYRFFRRWSVSGLLLLSILVSLVRWCIMGSTTLLPWLLIAQIMHSITFTVCHLAAMRFISAHKGSDVIRLQAVYSALSTGGGIAVMTIIAGVIFERYQEMVFFAMALSVLPALFFRPGVSTFLASQERQVR